MTNDEGNIYATPDPPPMSAPTEPQEDLDDFDDRRSTWPNVIGITSIIFGSFGVLCNCAGVFAPWAMGMLLQSQQGGTQDAGMEAAAHAYDVHAVLLIASSVIAVFVAILLLVGGIMLVRRSEKSRTVHLAWAGLKICLALCLVALGLVVANTQYEYLMQNATQADADQARIGAYVSAGIQIVWLLVWPVFTLIWFMRGKIRDEVASWANISSDYI